MKYQDSKKKFGMKLEIELNVKYVELFFWTTSPITILAL